MTWALRLHTALLGGALGAAGGAGFVAALPAADLVAPLGIAAAAGAAAASLRRPSGPEALHLLGFAALVVLGAAVALGTAPTVLSEAWGPAGWPALRDSPPPAPPTPEALAVPYLLTSLAAYLGTTVALRARWGVVAWSPSLVAMLAGYLLGDEWRVSSLLVPAGWAALALLSARERPEPQARRLSFAPDLVTGVVGAALVVLVVAAAIPLGGRLPLGSARWILSRAAVPAPTESEHPLVTVVRLRNGPDDVLFTAETTAPVGRWRLTVLDEYDGQRWASSQQFRPAASDLPAPPEDTPRSGSEIDQQIELNLPAGSDEMPWGRWLPAADGVQATSEDGLLFDAGTTVLLAPEEELPLRYDATSAEASTDDGPRSNARAATDDSARAVSRLPDDGDLLEDLAELGDELTTAAASDYARAVAIQSHLLRNGQLVVDEGAPGGHTLRHVHDFLLAEDEELYGTAEQFSTAFVVLARVAGLPARVVVGFNGSGTAGLQEVTAHEATAWVEVRFDGLGWIPFDAVPDPTSDIRPPEPPSPSPSPEEADDDQPLPNRSSPEEPTGDENGENGSDSERTFPWTSPSWATPGTAALLAVALVGLLVLAGPASRRALRRRRRRRAASPTGQIAGAWATVVDDIRAGGLTVRRAMPVAEVVHLAAGQVPSRSDQLAQLGALANRSAFGRRPLEATDAARAWVLSTAIVRARRSTRSPRQRVREYFAWRQ